MAANEYKLRGTIQHKSGKKFVREEVQPKPEDSVLDIGCGTGEVSAYVAEHLVPKGKVIGVDPDGERIKIAQESYQHIKNLTFVVESSDDFPGMEQESYEVVYATHVLHWVEDKRQFFMNAYSSLKRGGRIALMTEPEMPPSMAQALNDLVPELSDHILGMHHFKDMSKIEDYCLAAGFTDIKTKNEHVEAPLENKHEYIKWLSATTHGAFDVEKITKERLEKFSTTSFVYQNLRLFALKD